MKISNLNNNEGFTLIELVVVILGLAALAGLTFPSFRNSIKLNKVEEAKALMNNFASDCSGKYRISTDPTDFIENATPDELDNIKLSTLQYQIDGDKNKCSHVAIKPLNEDDKDLFAFDFRMSSDGKILKTAQPSSNPDFLNSCRSWAGKNCGLSDAQKAEFARLAALAKAKAECISLYTSWLNNGNSGEYRTWDNNKENCSRPVFAFEGVPVNSLEAVNQALKAKYGRACADWRESKRNTISPNGKGETKTPECGGVQYWFHSGNIFTTKAAWTAHDNQLKEQVCIQNRSNALKGGVKGKYTYNPEGPPPCGKVVWLCNGEEYESLEAYKTTSCGATPPPPATPPIPPHCVAFNNNPLRPHPFCKSMRPERRQNNPLCVCK